MPEKVEDVYVNTAFGSVTESAAGTLTFSEIETGVSLFEKVAWIVHQIQYLPAAARLQECDAESDSLTFGVCVSNKISALDLDDPAVVDRMEFVTLVIGTAGTHHLLKRPFIRDFTSLPGGGIIIPPRPIYVAAVSAGMSAALTVEARIYFTHRKLSPDQYWELVEARRMVE